MTSLVWAPVVPSQLLAFENHVKVVTGSSSARRVFREGGLPHRTHETAPLAELASLSSSFHR